MSTIDPTLAAHAARLLVGTDVPISSALAVAAGRLPATGTVAAALRDGWDTAQPTDQSSEAAAVSQARL